MQNSAALDFDAFDAGDECLQSEANPATAILSEPDIVGLGADEQTSGRVLAVIIVAAAVLGSLFYAVVIYAVLT